MIFKSLMDNRANRRTGYAFPDIRPSPFARRAGIWLALLALALPLRLVWVNGEFYREQSWCEGHYACAARNLSRYGLLDQRDDYNPDRTFSPFVPALLWPTARLAGWRPWGFRVPLVLAGLAALLAFYALMRRRWGVPPRQAWLAFFFAASAPGIVYYSRNVQLDGVATAFLFFALWGAGHRSRTGRATGWLAWSLCALAKTAFILYLPALLLAAVARKQASWRSGRAWLGSLLLCLLGLAPVMAWTAFCYAEQHGETIGFFSRSNERTLPAILAALFKTRDILWRNLGPSILLLGLLGGLALLARWRTLRWRRLLAPGWIACAWLVLAFTHPQAYRDNQYYDYPGLYVACLLAAEGAVALWGWLKRRVGVSPLFAASALALITLLNIEEYIRHFGVLDIQPAVIARQLGMDTGTLPPRFYSDRGVDVFQSARNLARHEPAKGLILADYPATMFYAGADPKRVRCAWGSVAAAFNPQTDTAVLLDLFIPHKSQPGAPTEEAFIQRLRALGWRQTSPHAWVAPTFFQTGK